MDTDTDSLKTYYLASLETLQFFVNNYRFDCSFDKSNIRWPLLFVREPFFQWMITNGYAIKNYTVIFYNSLT